MERCKVSKARKLISKLKQEWSLTRKLNYCNDSFELLCAFSHEDSRIDLKKLAFKLGMTNIPAKYLDFIEETDGTKIFYDQTFGQAGMYLYETDVIYEKNLE